MLIDVRCQHCTKLLCKVSKDFYGIVQVKCRHCKKPNTVSLAIILTQLRDDSDIIKFPKRVPAQ